MRIAFWAFAALLVPNLVTLAAQDRSAILASPDTTVTDAERRGLHVDVDSIRHTLFRFVLPNPGSGFSLNPDYQRLVDESFAEHPDMVAWAFHDPVERQAFVIQVTKMSRVNETGFRNFTAGIPEGFGKAKIVKDSLSWRESIGDFSLTALHPAGFYITVRCLGRGQPAVIVCVQTTTAEPDALTSSRAGLRFIP